MVHSPWFYLGCGALLGTMVSYEVHLRNLMDYFTVSVVALMCLPVAALVAWLGRELFRSDKATTRVLWSDGLTTKIVGSVCCLLSGMSAGSEVNLLGHLLTPKRLPGKVKRPFPTSLPLHSIYRFTPSR